jgi:hypothetical protein
MTFTTVSFTPFSRRLSAYVRAVVATLFLATVPAYADGITVLSADLEPGEDGYNLNAAFDLNFSPTLDDALNRGVVLTFQFEFELTRGRWYWFDEKIVQMDRGWRLSYNALTRQYRLSVGSLYQNFDRLDEAKRVLSRIRGLPVLERNSVKKGAVYEAGVRLRLDVSKLPKPFQIDALASREWNLSSDWHRFTFTP